LKAISVSEQHMASKNGLRTFRPRPIRSRTIHPTDCSSQIVQIMLFNCLLEAGLMK